MPNSKLEKLQNSFDHSEDKNKFNPINDGQEGPSFCPATSTKKNMAQENVWLLVSITFYIVVKF